MDTETQPDVAADPADAAPPTRTFTLVEHVEVDGELEPLNRVAFGADPRIEIHAGETYSTDDPRIAARCAAHPHLIESTAAAAEKPEPAKRRKAVAS